MAGTDETANCIDHEDAVVGLGPYLGYFAALEARGVSQRDVRVATDICLYTGQSAPSPGNSVKRLKTKQIGRYIPYYLVQSVHAL